MVLAAVESALAQTHSPLEVIVVIDGPEKPAGESTAALLATVADERLRVLPLDSSVGGAEARNLGVQAASGEWVAFLDDDDLWLPEKLAVQMEQASRSPAGSIPVMSCLVLARSPHWEEVWPREPYRDGQPLSEYLFCRRGWRYGSALLQTSTLVAPRALLVKVPFARGLKKHQDWDWLLRAGQQPSVQVQSAGDAPLAVFHVEGDRASVGRVPDWRFSLAWALERRQLFTRRAFAGFVATECAAQAEGEGFLSRVALMFAFLRNGIPPPAETARFLVFLCIPQHLRRRLREAGRRHWARSTQKRPASMPGVF